MYGPDLRPILERLYDAPLPPATLRVAVGLLAAANHEGYVILEWEQYLHLAQCNDVQAARRHLTRLRQQKIVDYTTNGKVWIHIKDWPITQPHAPESARIRAESTELSPPAAPADQVRAPEPARSRAESTELSTAVARPRAEAGADTRQNETLPIGRLGIGRGEDDSDPIHPEVRAMLEATGLNLTHLRVPNGLDPITTYNIIAQWKEDYQAGKVELGALGHRIKHARPKRYAIN